MLVTNREKYNLLSARYRGAGSFFFALFTNGTTPTADINTVSELTQIATGNGYSDGGLALTGNATDFDILTEDDTNDRALIQIKDIVFTASGNLPASGAGASYGGLTGPHATVGSREVLAVWDLGGARQITNTQTLTIQNCEIRIS